MTSLERFFATQIAYTDTDRRRREMVTDSVPGYSMDLHYAFFQHLLRTTDVHRILVLGVYFGRDISFLCSAAMHHGRALSITGVDKFSDDFCDDWPDERKAMDWQAAGFGPAPSLEQAQHNVAKWSAGHRIELIRKRDDEFLAECRDTFDLIYIDTSHDYDTVRRQLLQARPLAREDGLLAGDDYSDEGTWGVKRAVSELAPEHRVIGNWIWLTTPAQIAG